MSYISTYSTVVVRVGAIARGPLKRDYHSSLISDSLSSKPSHNSTTRSNRLKFNIETVLLLSSPVHESGDMWRTPKRARVRQAPVDGKSWSQIHAELGVPKATAQRICKAKSSRTTRKGKACKRRLLNTRAIRRIIRYIAQNWSTRRATFEQVKRALGIEASARTIRRELRKAGYRRCIACPRPFISRKQAKKRLDFALSHRWWGTSDWAASRLDGGDWRKVIWSDECIFELGKNGRIWVTRRVDEKRCSDCIKSTYRSGRVTVMIWGAIGWDWKSPLVFLEKEEGCKGVNSRAYRDQVLYPIVFPLFDELGPEYIFQEDGSKVHKGYARLAKLQHSIRGFDWPPSSPDLNVIEKVWRWMKEELKKLPFVPTSVDSLKEEIQKLWDRVDPRDYRQYTERLTCKLEDVITVKGLATIH